jgi:PAS domain S-box-containing protein
MTFIGREMKQEDNKLFQSAFKFASIGMAIVSPTGHWLMVNSSLCQMIGYTEEEIGNLTFQHITHPDDLKQDLDLVGRTLKGEINSYQMEKRYFHKNGSIVWAILSVSLIRDIEQNPLYFISQIQDITQLKKAEKQIAETEKLTAIYEITVKLAHEINNPLTIISINCEVIDQLLKEPNPDMSFIEKLNVKSALAAERITGIMKAFKQAENTTNSIKKIPELPESSA